jgi:uncharacterized protein YfaS (alpha-2-macroglobulin family)
MKVRTGSFPPLVKFASSPFAVVERSGEQGVVPLTVRAVEAKTQIRSLRLTDDAAIVRWLARLHQYHESEIELPLPKARQTADQKTESIATRTLSVFEARDDGSTVSAAVLRAARDQSMVIDLPSSTPQASAQATTRPFEVVGLPLKESGLYVLEASSKVLGRALLDRDAPLYVRTGALVTNLAVHIKSGRESSAVWVTRLDTAKPVANAAISVLDCSGRPFWSGATDAQGLARFTASVKTQACEHMPGWVAIARAPASGGNQDLGLAISSWQQGIEPWRFGLPTGWDHEASVRAHSVLDRMLLRAGETVQMKHLIRMETEKGLALMSPDRLPEQLRIVHVGSDETVTQSLVWRSGKDALSSWRIPKAAKLGLYQVFLGDQLSGSFRVEEFKLPALQARLVGPAAAQVGVDTVTAPIQVIFQSGGPASGLDVTLSATSRIRQPQFEGYERFRFGVDAKDGEDDEQVRTIVDSRALKLDAKGSGQFTIERLQAALGKAASQPQTLNLEMQTTDPNGQVETTVASTVWYPASVVGGLRADRWASAAGQVPLQMVVLNTGGKPVAGARVELSGTLVQRFSTRKRLVGGFYAYDNRIDYQPKGVLCSGKTDTQGLFSCEAKADTPGEWRIEGVALDEQGRKSLSQITQYVVDPKGREGWWFEQGDDDRIDLIAEKPRYRPGETARIQLRMPFRQATVWLATEREGVIEQRVLEVNGTNPTIEVPIKGGYAPNVFVSVLAVRARVTPLGLNSFMQWGWKTPRQWWQARQESLKLPAASSTIDLAKPAFKLGVVNLRVEPLEQTLQLKVAVEKPVYRIREKAMVTVQALDASGKPLPAGSVLTIAAVDQALLDLQPNTSWSILEALMRERSWEVETATAQQQVVGKRHYGRKAVPAGGDGGKAPTRELLDTLLVWKPDVVLDAQGQARFEVPINDVLSTFQVVAIAAGELDRFGHGQASFRVTQDLQILSGLAPVVREGDRIESGVTLRNTTDQAMQVQFLARSALGEHKQTVALPAQAAQEVRWTSSVAANTVDMSQGFAVVAWALEAIDAARNVSDRLRFEQRVEPAVPVQVQQATVFQVAAGQPQALPVQAPAGALAGRGGVRVQYAPTLAASLDSVMAYFQRYPFSCIEQQASRAVGLNDPQAWQRMLEALPSYRDRDGLVDYFPPTAGSLPQGSEVLTAALLRMGHEAAKLDAGFQIPQALRESLEASLVAIVEGKVKRPSNAWSAQTAALDPVMRRLLVLDALAISGKVRPAMLEPIAIQPASWPTMGVLAWINVLKQQPALPQAAERLMQAEDLVRARLSLQGTRLSFAEETSASWWWLMGHPDVDAARLMLHVVDSKDARWTEEAPRMMLGVVGRLQAGQWWTTQANAFGALAVRQFVQRFEKNPVQGQSAIALKMPGSAPATARAGTWPASANAQPLPPLFMPWGGAERGMLALAHEGSGAPWAMVQSLAAVPLRQARSAGFEVERTMKPVEQKTTGPWARGDIAEITLKLRALGPATWIGLKDPIPAGARNVGPVQVLPGATGGWQLAYTEQAFDAQRIYFRATGPGVITLTYRVQLNASGQFQLPPTRIEAMYNPEMFGEAPNPVWVVQ